MTYPEKRKMPNADNNLCWVVCLSMLFFADADADAIIRINREMMRDRRLTIRINHTLNPSLIPNDKRTEPMIAIDTNTDIVDMITSFMISMEYCSRCLIW